jgi:hypothetical protein
LVSDSQSGPGSPRMRMLWEGWTVGQTCKRSAVEPSLLTDACLAICLHTLLSCACPTMSSCLSRLDLAHNAISSGKSYIFKILSNGNEHADPLPLRGFNPTHRNSLGQSDICEIQFRARQVARVAAGAFTRMSPTHITCLAVDFMHLSFCLVRRRPFPH